MQCLARAEHDLNFSVDTTSPSGDPASWSIAWLSVASPHSCGSDGRSMARTQNRRADAELQGRGERRDGRCRPGGARAGATAVSLPRSAALVLPKPGLDLRTQIRRLPRAAGDADGARLASHAHRSPYEPSVCHRLVFINETWAKPMTCRQRRLPARRAAR
jgi:hypothetical protein